MNEQAEGLGIESEPANVEEVRCKDFHGIFMQIGGKDTYLFSSEL